MAQDGLTRRTALATAAAATIPGSARANTCGPEVETISTLRTALANKALSAVEATKCVQDRITATESLGLFTSLNNDSAITAAEAADAATARGASLGPLHGVPIALKDNIDAVGYPTAAGTPALRAFHPQQDAPLVTRLKQAGAAIVGKLNMAELAGGGTTNNPAYLRTRNPYALDHIPGGSSGASGAVIAARVVPCALGSDTAGSVRNPASYCGVVGFRPSLERYPGEGIVPLALSRDTAGPLAHSVADIAVVDAVMAGDELSLPTANLSEVRLGVPSAPFRDNLTDDVAAMMADVEMRLEGAGVKLVRAEIPNLNEMVEEINLITLGADLRRDISAYLDSHGSDITFDDIAAQMADPFIKGWMTEFINPSSETLNEGARIKTTALPALRKIYAAYLQEHNLDGIVFPTVPVPASIEVPGTDTVIIDGVETPGGLWLNIQNATPASLWGCPGISLPAGLTARGLPMGVEIDGPIGADKKTLALAQAIEPLLPATPPPPLLF